jgi:hypothetical protein
MAPRYAAIVNILFAGIPAYFVANGACLNKPKGIVGFNEITLHSAIGFDRQARQVEIQMALNSKISP